MYLISPLLQINITYYQPRQMDFGISRLVRNFRKILIEFQFDFVSFSFQLFIGGTDLALSIICGMLLFVFVEEPFRKVGKFFTEKFFDKK